MTTCLDMFHSLLKEKNILEPDCFHVCGFQIERVRRNTDTVSETVRYIGALPFVVVSEKSQ